MSRSVIQIKTRDGQSEASVFQPDTGKGPWPGVLVYMDGRGIRPALFELGERIAARYLENAGWKIIARRFKSGRRDIDLVAQQNDLVAFVEVKARSGDEFGDPVEAVNHRKQREN